MTIHPLGTRVLIHLEFSGEDQRSAQAIVVGHAVIGMAHGHLQPPEMAHLVQFVRYEDYPTSSGCHGTFSIVAVYGEIALAR